MGAFTIAVVAPDGSEQVIWTSGDVGSTQVTAVSVSTQRGEAARILSPNDNDKIVLSLEIRDPSTSNFLDVNEDAARHARSAEIEAAQAENVAASRAAMEEAASGGGELEGGTVPETETPVDEGLTLGDETETKGRRR